jgi:diguanylate cyclase (GGDEF)-like protein
VNNASPGQPHQSTRLCERAVCIGNLDLLLLPGRTLDAAIALGEALRQAVKKESLTHPASALAPHVTISVGVAALVPSGETAAEQLVAAADRALYEAKTSGRDRVAWCTL